MANNVVAINGDDSKSQRPSNSAFKQQKLPSWQPILTAGTVLPTFFLIGVAFIPIGIGLLVSSNQVREKELDYTFCYRDSDASQSGNRSLKQCAAVLAETAAQESCICKLNFTLEEDYKSDVFIYYGLTNYFQNHRRYVKSRDDRQLLGEKLTGVTRECEPYAYRKENNSQLLPIAPCGAIANSLFNDTFTLEWVSPKSGKSKVPILQYGIAWATDRSAKFKNPSGSSLKEAFQGTVKPFNWRVNAYELGKNESNNGYLFEPFIVWMRTSALPTFRKIYGRVGHDFHDTETNYKTSLPKGDYILTVNYAYPVTSFKGTKHLIISNTSWLGGKNPFLGITYIVVGCICLILSAIFIIVHKKFGKSTNEILNVNPRTPFME